MSGIEKSNGYKAEEAAARRWESTEAAEAAEGMRPGLPGMWESWALLPAGQRTETEEIGQAIVAWWVRKDWQGLRASYEDAAARFERAAHAANELAFDILAEVTRERDEGTWRVYEPGKPVPPPFVAGGKVRLRLRRALSECRRWIGPHGPMLEIVIHLRGLTFAGLSLPAGEKADNPETWCNDHERICKVALNLRRMADLFRRLASQSVKPKGRLDVERLKLIRFAKAKGIGLRALARAIAGMGISASGERLPSPDALDVRVLVDDSGQFVSAKGKRVAAMDEDGTIPTVAEWNHRRADWIEREAAVWEDRLRSTEKGQRRARRR